MKTLSTVVAVALILGLVGCAARAQCNLTISSTEGGSVTTPGQGTASFTYDEGKVVDLVAEADEGYEFVNWTGDVGTIDDVNDASTSIAMNGDYSIAANFQPIRYDLTVSSTAGGSVTAPGTGAFAYDVGTVVSLIAAPASGYRFTKWTGDVGAVANVDAASTSITVNGDYSITANFEEEEEVHFPDANLEAAIREATDKPTGPIYGSDFEELTHLDAHQRGIADLTGLEYCTNLIQPWLWGNQISDVSPLANLTSVIVLSVGENEISDISPLANLTNLKELWIDTNRVSDISPLSGLTKLTLLCLWDNQISDISPLANLTNLMYLELTDNKVSDISPLATLTNLMYLDLKDNQVSQISPLASLTNLRALYLDSNHIVDISPISGLSKLGEVEKEWGWWIVEREGVETYLGLASNQITDITSLVENEGLSEQDGIDIRGNPLSSDSLDICIPELEERGVNVLYD